MPPSADLLQGTGDLLILKTLTFQPMHSWGNVQGIQKMSKDALQIGQIAISRATPAGIERLTAAIALLLNQA
jgi:hypothetical protein